MSAEIESTPQPVSTGEARPQPPSAEPSPAEAAPPPPPLPRRDVIAAAMKSPRPRDASGKFSTPPAEASAPPAPPAPPSRPEMPKTLPLELRAHWDAAHPDLLARYVQRDADFEKGVQPLRESKRQLDEIMSEFRPYEQLLRSEGSTPRQAISDLMRTASILRTGSPQEKALAVAQTMRQYGISPESLQQALGSGGDAPQPAFDPRQVSDLVQRELGTYQQRQSMEVIREFANDPANRHFERVQEWIPDILGAEKFRAENEGKTERERLKLAYDTACRLDPEVSRQIASDSQTAERTRQQVERAKSAAVQVSGAPASAPPQKINPGDRRELIRSAFRSAQ